MNDNRGREPRPLTSIGFLSPLAFGASFEELANFLIDNIVDRPMGVRVVSPSAVQRSGRTNSVECYFLGPRLRASYKPWPQHRVGKSRLMPKSGQGAGKETPFRLLFAGR